MSIILLMIVVIVILALVLYALSLAPFDAWLKTLLQILAILLAAAIIANRAGLV